ncbi:MAG TPA: TolC family protein [Chitinophagales bacterium]|nr:TolC family protein [Chitinophagales bacterium]
MKRIFVCMALAMYLTVSFAQDSDSLTLQQCIQTAIKNNLDVRQSELQMQTAEVFSAQARSNLLPAIFGNATHGINQGRSIDPYTNTYINQQVNFATYGVNGSVVLFNGFGLINSAKQNSLAYDASKMDFQQAKDNLTINVIVAYLQVLTENDLLASAQNQMTVSQKQVDRLEELNKQGAIVPSLMYDLKGQLANDKLAIINTQNTLDQAKITLSQLMNAPYNGNLQVQSLTAEQFSAIYDQTPDKIYATAQQQLAMVKAADLHLQSAEKGLAAARSNFYPVLSLNGGVNTNYSNAALQSIFQNTADITTTDYVVVDGNQLPVITQQQNFLSEKIPYRNQLENNLSTSVSVGLSIPIFNSFTAKHRVELAKINVENATAVSQTTRIQLKQEIDQAYFNMTAAYNRYKTSTDQVAAYRESFREAEVRFNTGANTSVDYLIAKNNADVATLNLIIARYDYVLRTKILDYYQGKALW